MTTSMVSAVPGRTYLVAAESPSSDGDDASEVMSSATGASCLVGSGFVEDKILGDQSSNESVSSIELSDMEYSEDDRSQDGSYVMGQNYHHHQHQQHQRLVAYDQRLLISEEEDEESIVSELSSDLFNNDAYFCNEAPQPRSYLNGSNYPSEEPKETENNFASNPDRKSIASPLTTNSRREKQHKQGAVKHVGLFRRVARSFRSGKGKLGKAFSFDDSSDGDDDSSSTSSDKRFANTGYVELDDDDDDVIGELGNLTTKPEDDGGTSSFQMWSQLESFMSTSDDEHSDTFFAPETDGPASLLAKVTPDREDDAPQFSADRLTSFESDPLQPWMHPESFETKSDDEDFKAMFGLHTEPPRASGNALEHGTNYRECALSHVPSDSEESDDIKSWTHQQSLLPPSTSSEDDKHPTPETAKSNNSMLPALQLAFVASRNEDPDFAQLASLLTPSPTLRPPSLENSIEENSTPEFPDLQTPTKEDIDIFHAHNTFHLERKALTESEEMQLPDSKRWTFDSDDHDRISVGQRDEANFTAVTRNCNARQAIGRESPAPSDDSSISKFINVDFFDEDSLAPLLETRLNDSKTTIQRVPEEQNSTKRKINYEENNIEEGSDMSTEDTQASDNKNSRKYETATYQKPVLMPLDEARLAILNVEEDADENEDFADDGSANEEPAVYLSAFRVKSHEDVAELLDCVDANRDKVDEKADTNEEIESVSPEESVSPDSIDIQKILLQARESLKESTVKDTIAQSLVGDDLSTDFVEDAVAEAINAKAEVDESVKPVLSISNNTDGVISESVKSMEDITVNVTDPEFSTGALTLANSSITTASKDINEKADTQEPIEPVLETMLSEIGTSNNATEDLIESEKYIFDSANETISEAADDLEDAPMKGTDSKLAAAGESSVVVLKVPAPQEDNAFPATEEPIESVLVGFERVNGKISEVADNVDRALMKDRGEKSAVISESSVYFSEFSDSRDASTKAGTKESVTSVSAALENSSGNVTKVTSFLKELMVEDVNLESPAGGESLENVPSEAIRLKGPTEKCDPLASEICSGGLSKVAINVGNITTEDANPKSSVGRESLERAVPDDMSTQVGKNCGPATSESSSGDETDTPNAVLANATHASDSQNVNAMAHIERSIISFSKTFKSAEGDISEGPLNGEHHATGETCPEAAAADKPLVNSLEAASNISTKAASEEPMGLMSHSSVSANRNVSQVADTVEDPSMKIDRAESATVEASKASSGAFASSQDANTKADIGGATSEISNGDVSEVKNYMGNFTAKEVPVESSVRVESSNTELEESIGSKLPTSKSTTFEVLDIGIDEEESKRKDAVTELSAIRESSAGSQGTIHSEDISGRGDTTEKTVETSLPALDRDFSGMPDDVEDSITKDTVTESSVGEIFSPNQLRASLSKDSSIVSEIPAALDPNMEDSHEAVAIEKESHPSTYQGQSTASDVPDGLNGRTCVHSLIDKLNLGDEGLDAIRSLRTMATNRTSDALGPSQCTGPVRIKTFNVNGITVPDYDLYVRQSIAIFQQKITKQQHMSF